MYIYIYKQLEIGGVLEGHIGTNTRTCEVAMICPIFQFWIMWECFTTCFNDNNRLDVVAGPLPE